LPSRREGSERTGAPVEQVGRDRLRYAASAGGDLVQLKVLQAVLEQ
jgi:hypothetical protein